MFNPEIWPTKISPYKTFSMYLYFHIVLDILFQEQQLKVPKPNQSYFKCKDIQTFNLPNSITERLQSAP